VSPFDKPTRAEALRYYRKVVDTYDLQIAYDEKVMAIDREAPTESGGSSGSGGLVGSGHPRDAVDGDARIFTLTTRSSRGVQRVRHARNVIMAIGYYDHPVMLGVPGEDLPHVHHYYGEPHPHYQQRVVIVGGGNSAAESALEMYRAGAKVTIVHRAPALKKTIKYWVRPDIENRIKEGSVKAHFSTSVVEITADDVLVEGPAGRTRLPAKAMLLMTGYRSDTTLLRTAGADVDPAIGAPFHNPDTFKTSVPGLYVVGACIAGKQSGRIFIENGRFHGEIAIRTIAERLGAREKTAQS